MKGLALVILVGTGCGLGDDLGAPKLVRRASNLVPVADLAFDAENRPLGLLDADHRRRLTRLGPGGWEVLASAETFNVLDLGAASDGTLLVTIGNLAPGSGVFQLAPDDELVQIGKRISTAVSFDPFQAPWGDMFVSTVDGGRRLSHGSEDWVIAKAFAQVLTTRDAVYGMSSSGLERLGIEDRDRMGTVLVPCAKFPAGCASVKFDGRDASGRMYFHVDGAPELWVLEAGADELDPLTIPGANALGSVLASPQFVVIEAIADGGDERHSALYLLPSGSDELVLVDLRARPTLDRPVLAIDHRDTVYVAHGDWLGTIEVE
jgi:hypothetical protein